MTDSFTIRCERLSDGTMAVVPAGELDMATVPALEAAVDDARSQAALVRLDLSELTFIDSSGVSYVLRLDALARSDGFTLQVVPGSERVHRVFEMVGIAHRLPFVRN